MTLLELFKKLVSISRPESAPLQPDEVLTGIIRDALTLNLEYVTGSAIDITVKGSEPGLFEKVLSASGYMVSTFCGDEVPCSQFILPAETARNLLAKMKSVHSDITVEEETNLLEAIKAGIVSLAKGFNPIVSVEFARRAMSSDHRPSFQEMEEFVKGIPGNK